VFLRQRYALFCGRHHALFGRDGLSVADLAGQQFVSFTGDKVGDHMSPLTIFRDEMGFTGRVIASSSSMAEVKRFIFSGLGIGCLPEHIVSHDIEQGRFQRLPPDEGVADVDVYFLSSQDRKLSAAEAAFVAALNRFIDAREA
jgi:DNA-binding transcriptional LysR family regulator